MRLSASFCVFLCVLIYESASQEFNITPIKTSSGLYYEKIGDVLLSNSNWEFVTSVDYAGYLLFYQYLHTQAQKLLEFCQEYQSSYCEERWNQIKAGMNRINETNEDIAHLLGVKTEISWSDVSKGLEGAMMEEARTIFGKKRNQVDLIRYDRQIVALQSSGNDFLTLLDQQTTLFLVDSGREASQIRWLEMTQVDLEKRTMSFRGSEEKRRQLDDLRKMLTEMIKELKAQIQLHGLARYPEQVDQGFLRIDSDLSYEMSTFAPNYIKSLDEDQYFSYMNSLMTQFESEQKKLLNVMKNASAGYTDSSILTPLSLLRMLQDIQRTYPGKEHQFLYLPSLENATLLYRLIENNIYFYNYKIMFISKIPLVDSLKFSVHKITSMPVAVTSNKFVFILPKKPFLLVNKDVQEFVMMSHEEFENVCHEINMNRYFCKKTQQLSNIHSSDDCEMNLFLKTTEIPETCDKRKLVLEQPMFLQLQKQSSWIYVVPQQQLVTVICGSQRHNVILEGTGFLSLAQNCTVRTNQFKLVPLVEFTKIVLSNYSAPANLTKFVDLSDVESWEIPESQGRTHIIFPFDLDRLDRLSLKPVEKANNLTWLYCIIGISLVFSLIILGIYIHIHKQKMPKYYRGDDGNGELKFELKQNDYDNEPSKKSVQKHKGFNDPEAEQLNAGGIEKEKPGASAILFPGMQTKIDDTSLTYGKDETQLLDDDDPDYEMIQ